MLQRLSARIGARLPSMTEQARAALQRYAFPGNVRELENILERAIALSATGVIDLDDLQLRQPAAAAPVDGTAGEGLAAQPAPMPAAASPGTALGDQLENIERAAIVKALEQTRYNKTAAAKLLGMSFRALRYRVKKLGIE
jgi:two-component system response regulator PilR (NtrC family)